MIIGIISPKNYGIQVGDRCCFEGLRPRYKPTSQCTKSPLVPNQDTSIINSLIPLTPTMVLERTQLNLPLEVNTENLWHRRWRIAVP